jgi:hypothetical protein
VIGLSGSFLANETGDYTWCIGDGTTSWDLVVDGWSQTLGEDSCASIKFIEGYRYDFRATTITASAIVDLLIQAPGSTIPEPISSYETETSETKGCADGELTRENGCQTGSTPAPKASPVSCGISGLLSTVHSMGDSENWQLTNQSFVRTTEENVIGLSGSFLCETDGTHQFDIQTQDSMTWRFLTDDFESIDRYGSDSFALQLTAGYRYGFRFLTVIPTDGTLCLMI